MKSKPKIVPLCDAVLFNDMDMFHKLINEGVDINERDYNNLTALWYAAQCVRYEMAKILIEHGADLEVKDPYGNTPLNTAVYNISASTRSWKIWLPYESSGLYPALLSSVSHMIS